MPTPPALKYAAWALEITLITPAMPIVSSDLLHSLPNSATPRSMSVKSQVRRAVGPPSAGEQPHSFRDLLLEVDAQARSAGVLAHRRERVASVKARGLGEVDGLLEIPHPSADQKAGDLEFARLTPKLMPFLDFSNQLKLLEGRVQAVGGAATGAALRDCPTACQIARRLLIQFDRCR
jgi:hypothetical protein